MELNPTRYARREHGPGFVSWIYEYWNTTPIEKRHGLGAGLELGVQLTGEWLHTGARHAKELFRPGTIHRIDPGELYELSFSGAAVRGTQVGFIVYPDEVGELQTTNEELRLPGDAGVRDRELFDFCKHYFASERREPPHAREVTTVLLGYLRRYGESKPVDPVLAGKRELERYFDRALRIGHIAEAAGMHPVTFARRFAARFGLTPASYRLRYRLNHAARLTWARKDMSIERIAEECGFTSVSFFHRRFTQLFGRTPARYGGRRPMDA